MSEVQLLSKNENDDENDHGPLEQLKRAIVEISCQTKNEAIDVRVTI
jgi:hypothetical protein